MFGNELLLCQACRKEQKEEKNCAKKCVAHSRIRGGVVRIMGTKVW